MSLFFHHGVHGVTAHYPLRHIVGVGVRVGVRVRVRVRFESEAKGGGRRAQSSEGRVQRIIGNIIMP